MDETIKDLKGQLKWRDARQAGPVSEEPTDQPHQHEALQTILDFRAREARRITSEELLKTILRNTIETQEARLAIKDKEIETLTDKVLSLRDRINEDNWQRSKLLHQIEYTEKDRDRWKFAADRYKEEIDRWCDT